MSSSFGYFVFYVARRYLRSRFTSYVAVAGVAVGVMVLVIVLSVMGGFQQAFWAKLRSSSGDITIDSYQYYAVSDQRELREKVCEIPGVLAAAPYIKSIVLIEGADSIDYGFLKAIDPKAEAAMGQRYLLSPRQTYIQLYDLKGENSPSEENIRGALLRLNQILEKYGQRKVESLDRIDGYFPSSWPREALFIYKRLFRLLNWRKVLDRLPDRISFGRTSSGLPAIVVGIEMFKALRLRIGSIISLTAASGETAGVGDLKGKEFKTNEGDFEVVGTAKVGIFTQDRRGVYMGLRDAQKFIDIGQRVSGIYVRVEDGRDVELLKWKILLRLQGEKRYSHLVVRTWKELNRSLFQAVQMEKFLLSFLLFFIIMVAGFMIFAILSMLVVEKTKDVGILKALGGDSWGVMSIFLSQGLIIGLIGSLLGLGLGLLFTYNINEVALVIEKFTGYHPFPPRIYYLDKIPTKVELKEILFISLPTVLVSLVFSLFPAYRASRLNAIESLRYE